MKKLGLGFVLVALLACESETISEEFADKVAAEGIEKFDCLNSQADAPPALDDAKEWIVGKWQLKGMITMMPQNEVPNIQLEFKEDGGVFVSLAGENVYTDAYSVIETEENGYKSIQLIGDNMMIDETGDYLLPRGTLRICEDEMMIDQGIAFDAPGYLFRRLQ